MALHAARTTEALIFILYTRYKFCCMRKSGPPRRRCCVLARWAHARRLARPAAPFIAVMRGIQLHHIWVVRENVHVRVSHTNVGHERVGGQREGRPEFVRPQSFAQSTVTRTFRPRVPDSEGAPAPRSSSALAHRGAIRGDHPPPETGRPPSPRGLVQTLGVNLPKSGHGKMYYGGASLWRLLLTVQQQPP